MKLFITIIQIYIYIKSFIIFSYFKTSTYLLLKNWTEVYKGKKKTLSILPPRSKSLLPSWCIYFLSFFLCIHIKSTKKKMETGWYYIYHTQLLLILRENFLMSLNIPLSGSTSPLHGGPNDM